MTVSFLTVPWAPGMEERQLDGRAWQGLREKQRLMQVALSVTHCDLQLFRWQTIMRIMDDGKRANPYACLMLALGMLDSVCIEGCAGCNRGTGN